MVKISIIIPTFNSEKFLKITFKSILSQTYKNYEVIVCDNYSKDRTKNIVKYFLKLDKNIKFFQKKDKGVADALNFGFKKAKGQILCWLNSDDLYFHSNVLKVISEEYERTRFNFLIGNFINIDSANKVIKSFYSFIPKKKIKYFFYYNQIFTGSLFFSKNAYKKFGGFNNTFKYSFEYDLIFFLLKNFKGFYLNNFLYYFRILNKLLFFNKILLKKEKNILLKKYRLFYTNLFIFRLISYFKNKILFQVISNMFFDKNSNSKFKF